jgi:hypothetical protein
MGNFVLQIGPCSFLYLCISPWRKPFLFLLCSLSLTCSLLAFLVLAASLSLPVFFPLPLFLPSTGAERLGRRLASGRRWRPGQARSACGAARQEPERRGASGCGARERSSGSARAGGGRRWGAREQAAACGTRASAAGAGPGRKRAARSEQWRAGGAARARWSSNA